MAECKGRAVCQYAPAGGNSQVGEIWRDQHHDGEPSVQGALGADAMKLHRQVLQKTGTTVLATQSLHGTRRGDSVREDRACQLLKRVEKAADAEREAVVTRIVLSRST